MRANRPFPGDGTIGQNYYMGKSALHSLNMSFTKRLSHNWRGRDQLLALRPLDGVQGIR